MYSPLALAIPVFRAALAPWLRWATKAYAMAGSRFLIDILFNYLRRAIFRTVIHDDDFDVRISLGKYALDGRESLMRAIVGWNDGGNQWIAVHCYSQGIRMKITAKLNRIKSDARTMSSKLSASGSDCSRS